MSNGIMSRKPTQSGQPPRAAGINLGAPPFMQKPSIGSSIIPAEKTGVLGKMDYMRLMKMAERMTDKELQQEMVRPQQFPQAITAAVAMGRAKTRKASALNEMAKGPKMPTVSEQVLAELSKEDSIDRGLADMAAFAQMSQNMGSPKGGIDRGMNPTMGAKEGGIIKYQNRGQVRSNPYSLMSGAQAMPVAFDMTNYLGGMGLNRKQEEYARQIAEMAKAQGISEDRIPYLINTALAESSLGANPAAFKVTEGDSSAGFYQAVPTTAFDPGFGAQGFQFSEGVSEALAPFRDKNLGPGALAKQLKGTKYGDSDLYTAMQKELIENIPGNINFGIGYQNALMDRYGGDPELSAIAYNQGAAYADQIKNTMEKAASGQEGFSEFEGMSAAEVLKLTNPKAYEEAYGSKEGQPSYMDRMLSGTGAEASSVDFKVPGAKGSSVFPDLSTLTTLEQVQKEQNKLLPIIGTEFGSNRSKALDKLEKEIKNKQDPFYISPDDPRVLEAAMERGNMPDRDVATRSVDPITQMAKKRETYTLSPEEGTGGAPDIITRDDGLTIDEREQKKFIEQEKQRKGTIQNSIDGFVKQNVPDDQQENIANEMTNLSNDVNKQSQNIDTNTNPGAGENLISNTFNKLDNLVGSFKQRSNEELLQTAKDIVNEAGGGVKNMFQGLMDSFNKNVDDKTKFNIMSALPFLSAAKAALVGGQSPLEALINAATGGAQAAMKIKAYEDKRKDAQDKKKLLLGRLQVALAAGEQDQVVKLMSTMKTNDANMYKSIIDGNVEMMKLERDAAKFFTEQRTALMKDDTFTSAMGLKVDEIVKSLQRANKDPDDLAKNLPRLKVAIQDEYINRAIYGPKAESLSTDPAQIINSIKDKKKFLGLF